MAGEKLFNRCRACHQVGEGARNLVGPQLNGVFGRKAGSLETYRYSAPMKASGLTWNAETFREFVMSPQSKVPGTKMYLPGQGRDSDIDNILAFLKQFDAQGKKVSSESSKTE